MNSVGELLSRYIYVGDEHSPTMMEKGSERYIFIKDERGSIEKVVNIKSGEVVEEISYGDWGNIKSDSNAEFQPFRYAGGLYDSDTGLIRFGARDYDPRVGRWTSKDPIGFAGGDTNLYGYVVNDPINGIDPDGRSMIGVVAGVVCGLIDLYSINQTLGQIQQYTQQVASINNQIKALNADKDCDKILELQQDVMKLSSKIAALNASVTASGIGGIAICGALARF